jgi:hypothetical protein
MHYYQLTQVGIAYVGEVEFVCAAHASIIISTDLNSLIVKLTRLTGTITLIRRIPSLSYGIVDPLTIFKTILVARDSGSARLSRIHARDTLDSSENYYKDRLPRVNTDDKLHRDTNIDRRKQIHCHKVQQH